MKNTYRTWSVVLIVVVALVAWFIYASQLPGSVFSRFAFKLGLDLNGGTELIYQADVSQVPAAEVADSMSALKDVIERRVNLFGVSEPVVQVEKADEFSNENKLIVDLPGVTNVEQAENQIGQTPLLDFRLIETQTVGTTTGTVAIPTGLTGRYLSQATLEFNNQSGEPTVALQFNSQGAVLFDQITKDNIGKTLGIFLDNQPISTPVIQQEIPGGQAIINGTFTAQAAETLVRNLNYGALPVPITLISTQTIGPSLGASALHSGIKAGILGFIIVAIFLILWYRLPGLVASLALVMYIILSLAAFKLVSVTFTAAGLAGFILSIGMAVDANILIFERMKEELRRGKHLDVAMHEGFHRAWLSIRDSNISSIITSLVLFWLGTSEIKGFALTLGLGVVISMFTAITVSRTFLFALSASHENKVMKFLFGTGFRMNNSPANQPTK
jgi:preprotein translocase subunit SecD